MKVFTDAHEWLSAMRMFADDHPDWLWLHKDATPYVAYVACDIEDPDPDHARTFGVTLGALRRGSGLLHTHLTNERTRTRIASDLNDPSHPLTYALLEAELSTSMGFTGAAPPDGVD